MHGTNITMLVPVDMAGRRIFFVSENKNTDELGILILICYCPLVYPHMQAGLKSRKLVPSINERVLRLLQISCLTV